VVLTKPLGVGVVSAALKKGEADPAAIRAMTESVTALNRAAAERMVEAGAHAATDITGFGLVLHLLNVAKASSATIALSYRDLPVLPSVRDLLRRGIRPGACFTNEQAAHRFVRFDPALSREDQLLLFDPQTSGGLAIFLPEEKAAALIRTLSDDGVSAVRIGTVLEGEPGIDVEL
jgi:selenide,water dikinase